MSTFTATFTQEQVVEIISNYVKSTDDSAKHEAAFDIIGRFKEETNRLAEEHYRSEWESLSEKQQNQFKELMK